MRVASEINGVIIIMIVMLPIRDMTKPTVLIVLLMLLSSFGIKLLIMTNFKAWIGLHTMQPLYLIFRPLTVNQELLLLHIVYTNLPFTSILSTIELYTIGTFIP